MRRRHRPAPARLQPRRAKGAPRQVEGILKVHQSGFGFVRPLTDKGQDIYLPAHEARRALDGDQVLIEVRHRDRPSGRLLKVTRRLRRVVVGTYVDRGNETFVLPRDRSLPQLVRVRSDPRAQDGDLVKVRLRSGASVGEDGGRLSGEVVGSAGDAADPSAEALSIAYAHGFDDEFPPEVLAEASRIPLQVSKAEASAPERRDLRSLPLVTIDGEDARDFDDAVYAEARDNGFRLVVAIADVAHYVREGSALDAEARRRGTSVYLPNQVLPMLPERLSNGICSLRPGEDRLCLVAEITFGTAGELQSSELYPGVMRSAARCTYREVQAFLDGSQEERSPALRKSFRALHQLAVALLGMRQRRGAIDFDLPETRVVLDSQGRPLRMERRERTESHRLIEECMLAANEAVAQFFEQNQLPTIYRYHGEPDEEKLAEFAQLANAHGFRLGARGRISPNELNVFLEKLEGHPERRALNQLLLRSMMQAVYSSEAVGHYGLGADHYLHFTSPIRRYPDRVVHRLLKAAWGRKGKRLGIRQLKTDREMLSQIAAESSERERAAIEVEREVTAYYGALLMKDRVGEEFDAVVSSLADFGFFVELEALWVEGLVKGESIGPDFRFDKKLHLCVSASSKLKIRVGQRGRVRLVSVNVKRRQLDFEWLAPSARATKKNPSPGGRGELL